MAYKFKTRKYVTTRGHEITLREIPILAISSLRQEYIEAHGDYPKVPTYLSPTDEVLPLTENRLDTDEEKEKWQAYKDAAQEWESGFTQFQFGFMALEAVVWDESLESLMDEWEKKSRAMKRSVPEDVYAKRIKFAHTEIFTGLKDMTEISRILGELSGAPAQEARKLEGTFSG